MLLKACDYTYKAETPNLRSAPTSMSKVGGDVFFSITKTCSFRSKHAIIHTRPKTKTFAQLEAARAK